MTDPQNPLIVQSDLTVLLEVAAPHAEQARRLLSRFAELERSPEHVHTYRITSLSLWNAAATGAKAAELLAAVGALSKYPVPDVVAHQVRDLMGRYGRLALVPDANAAPDGIALATDEPTVLMELAGHRLVKPLLGEFLGPDRVAVRLADRGALKQSLTQLGWPPEDRAGYFDGDPIDLTLRSELRGYQRDAVDAWKGDGVVVLPCGAGKTLVGIGAIESAATETLILVTSQLAAHQWIAELGRHSSLDPAAVGFYSGDRKEIRPVTVATYQQLTWRPPAGTKGAKGAKVAAAVESVEDHPHLALFANRAWGLVIYDEVHLLPAPVFRATARIQSVRRIGLTATLVREDGREGDVFALIGPKRFETPWRDLEDAGWIAPAVCTEVRVRLSPEYQKTYARSEERQRPAVAANNPAKHDAIEALLGRHPEGRVLIIGRFLEQIEEIAASLDAPLITGKTPQRERRNLLGAFRSGDCRLLVLSNVGNHALDLPEANVAIQVSGTFGSRQEEAQRLGRILRPKADGSQAHFYSLVSRGTVEQDYAAKRQRFLAEQGYPYVIEEYGEESGA